MRSDYMVKQLLNRLGRPLVLTRQISAIYNPATGLADGGTLVTYNLMGYLSESKNTQVQSTNEGVREVVLGSRQTDGSLFTGPLVGDRLTGFGDPMKVTEVQTVSEGTRVAFYLCKVSD